MKSNKQIVYNDCDNHTAIVFPIENNDNKNKTINIDSIYLQSLLNTIDYSTNTFSWIEKRTVERNNYFDANETDSSEVYVLCTIYINNGFYRTINDIINAINEILNNNSTDLNNVDSSYNNYSNRVLKKIEEVVDQNNKDITDYIITVSNYNFINSRVYTNIYPCSYNINMNNIYDIVQNKNMINNNTLNTPIDFIKIIPYFTKNDSKPIIDSLKQFNYESEYLNNLTSSSSQFIKYTVNDSNITLKFGLKTYKVNVDNLFITNNGYIVYNYSNNYNYTESILYLSEEEINKLEKYNIQGTDFTIDVSLTEVHTVINRYPLFPEFSNIYVNYTFIEDIESIINNNTTNIIKTIDIEQFIENGLLKMNIDPNNGGDYNVYPLIDNLNITLNIPRQTTIYVYITSDLFNYPLWRANNYIVYEELY